MANDINLINSVEEVEALIAEEEARQETAYSEIGKLYYVKHSTDCEEDFKPYIEELASGAARIEECKKRILTIKGIGTCPKCGAYTKSTSLFCTACGALLKEGAEVPAPPKETVACSRCGSEMKKNMRFCTVCGNPLTAPEQLADAIPPTRIYEPEKADAPIEEPAAPAEVAPVQETPAVEPAAEPVAEPVVTPAVELPAVGEPVPTAPAAPKPEPVRDPYAAPEPSVICPMCGKVSAPGMRFCVACGTRLTEEPAPAPAQQSYAVRRCQNCGHISANPAMPFCTECGTRLN